MEINHLLVRKVSPMLARADVPNLLQADSVLSCEEDGPQRRFSYGADLFFGEPRAPRSRSARSAVTAFRYTVGPVVGIGAKPQMRNIYAGGNVAFVQHVDAGGDRAVCVFPGKPVRSAHFAAPLQHSVPLPVSPADPQAASAWTHLAVVLKRLSQRPMRRADKAYSFALSHMPAPLKRLLVRARGGGGNAVRARLIHTTETQQRRAFSASERYAPWN